MKLTEAGITNRVFIKAYGPSNGAKALAQELGCKRIKLKNSRYKPRKSDIVINWGWSKDDYINALTLNKGANIRLASNKISFFDVLQDADLHDSIVQWTDNKECAALYLRENHKNFIYCRKTVTGHRGAGIVIARTPEELVDAPLYTVGIAKAREYRAHVGHNGIFHLQQKKRRNGGNQDGLVKNHGNGWVFVTEGITPIPQETEGILVKMLNVLGLDFAAFDFLVKNNEVFVLEANTAPGLEGTTVKKYSEMICNIINERDRE